MFSGGKTVAENHVRSVHRSACLCQ